ncbi:MAG: response regulator transcription factor [Anaerolineaceae bacterium]|nr:response regulator transcription factor [Anaerolineaceae bacterium]
MKVFIADNEKKVRNAIRVLVESDGRFHICAEAANVQELFSYLNFSKPDILLLDQSLYGMKATPRTLETIRAVVPDIKIIVLSLDAQNKTLTLAADAMISKFSSPQNVVATIEKFSPRSISIPQRCNQSPCSL